MERKLKTYNLFNESLKDKIVGKSVGDIKSALLNLTPHGMSDRLKWQFDDIDDVPLNELEKIADEKVDKIIKELDEIFDSKENKELVLLVEEVAKWVNVNGGNSENVLDYGLKEVAGQLVNAGIDYGRHDSYTIYDENLFNLYKNLLKEFAIQEVSNNNIDYGNDF